MRNVSVWKCLKEFNKLFGFPIRNKPSLPGFPDKKSFEPHLQTIHHSLVYCSSAIPSTDERSLRIKLLLEEVAEYISAELANDITKIADALSDIHYIAAGTEVIYGIPGEQIFDHVHENNMSKVGIDGKPIFRDDGKVLKPPGYVQPNIKKFFS